METTWAQILLYGNLLAHAVLLLGALWSIAVGDFLLFVGVVLFANSGVVAVSHLFTAMVLLLAPFAEEPWLDNHYGDDYAAYRLSAPRYL